MARVQFSLRTLLGIGILFAVGVSLMIEGVDTFLFALALVPLGIFALRGSPEDRTQRLGIAFGAYAGYLLVAIHGRVLPLLVYDGFPDLVGFVRSAAVFGACGLAVAVADRVRFRARFVVNWVLLGLVVGPMMQWIAIVIASTQPGRVLPVVDASRVVPAVVFAMLVGGTLGGVAAVVGSEPSEQGDQSKGEDDEP